ncbi:hypothetical protein VQ056_29600 [Paenibacillus sp. JTLBN-2024]
MGWRISLFKCWQKQIKQNQLFELALITGGKRSLSPLHCHEHLFETIFVLEERSEVMLDGKKYMVTAFDYIHILRKTIHVANVIVIKQDLFHIRWGGKMTDVLSANWEEAFSE